MKLVNYQNPWNNSRKNWDHFVSQWMRSDFAPFASTNNGFALDVEKKENSYIVEAELPGISLENIHLDMEDGILTIAIDQEETSEKEEKNYVHKECRRIHCARSLEFGAIEEDGIQANLKNGVLHIELPMKQEVEKKKSIAISGE